MVTKKSNKRAIFITQGLGMAEMAIAKNYRAQIKVDAGGKMGVLTFNNAEQLRDVCQDASLNNISVRESYEKVTGRKVGAKS